MKIGRDVSPASPSTSVSGDARILRECAWAGSTPTPNLVPWMSVAC